MTAGAAEAAPRPCLVGGCAAPICARELCRKHYQAAYRGVLDVEALKPKKAPRKVNPALCKKEGCTRNVRARGMCVTHYKQWSQANKEVRTYLTTRRLVLECLPGKLAEIAAESGLDLTTVRLHINAAHKAGAVFIARFDPPNVTGSRWLPIWQEGPGKDAVLSAKTRKRYRQDTQNRNRAIGKMLKRSLPDGKANWATPLGMGGASRAKD